MTGPPFTNTSFENLGQGCSSRRSRRFPRQTLPWVRNHSHIRVRIRTRCSRIPLAVVQGPRRRFRPRVCGGNVQLGFVV